MAAARAVPIGGAHGAEAVAAVGGEPVVALRAEVEAALHLGAASRAARDHRLTQEEVEHSADATGHDKANEDPEPELMARRGASLLM